MFENSLTYFVGVACYNAKTHFAVENLPQGVIEKMLSISRKLNITIEGVETVHSLFGDTNKQLATNMVADAPSVHLPGVTSKYFQTETKNTGTTFATTDAFKDALPQLSKKLLLNEYDSCITQLLRFWKADGELANLIYLSLVCADDAGVNALAADLELMLGEITEYTKRAFYLPKSKRPINQATTLGRVRQAEEGLRQKLRIVRNAPAIRERLEPVCQSMIGHRILNSGHALPPDCHLWSIIEWLCNVLRRITDKLLAIPHDLPILQAAAVEELAAEVAGLYRYTHCPPPPCGPETHIVVALIEHAAGKIKSWIRAVIARFDMKYYRQNTPDNDFTGKNHIVCYDISHSSTVFRQEARRQRTDLVPRMDKWRTRLAAAPWNWSVLFNGSIARDRGDREIALFEQPTSAFLSLLLTVAHIEAFNSAEHDPDFPYLVKAGIGTGQVFILAQQAESVTMNDAYAAITELVDQKTLRPTNEPVVLALESFMNDHQQLQAYAGASCAFANGNARQINWQAALHQFVQSLT